MKVAVWTRGIGQDAWQLDVFEFPAVPRVGEYLTPRDDWSALRVNAVDYTLAKDGTVGVAIEIDWINPAEWNAA